MTDKLPFFSEKLSEKLSEKDTRAPKPEMPALIWDGDSKLRIHNINFHLTYDTSELQRAGSVADNFILGKPRHMVERAVEIASRRRIDKVFEMGILRGGSVVLYDQIFSPTSMVAIDLTAEPVAALTDYIDRHGKAGVVKPYYAVSQSDRSAMESLLSAEFPGRDIDLIIDDASHLYEHTRDAFNIAFPFLAPGGLYVVEDWAWAHWTGDYWQGKKQSSMEKFSTWARKLVGLPVAPVENSYFAGKTALSNLLVELLMLSASRPDLVEDLFIDHNMVMVRKGKGSLPPGNFHIADHYLLRGKKYIPWL